MIHFFCDDSAEAGMRGAFVDQGGLCSYIAPEARVPANHPLRKIRELVRDVLGELNRSLGRLYASEGRRDQSAKIVCLAGRKLKSSRARATITTRTVVCVCIMVPLSD